MGNRKVKWLMYTVLVGLLPILSRLMVWVVTKEGTVNLWSPSDFVAFGLVLHISNINEIEHFSDLGKDWKTIQNGISIVFIVFYSVLFAITLIGGSLIDIHMITICTVVLSAVSFLISYSVYDRVTKASSYHAEGVS